MIARTTAASPLFTAPSEPAAAARVISAVFLASGYRGRAVAPLHVLHRHPWLVAVAKPPGLAVHRSGEVHDRTPPLQRVRDQFGCWVYPVHRLDRGTSGVLLFALGPETARTVGAALTRRDVDKRYLAIVRGFAPEHV